MSIRIISVNRQGPPGPPGSDGEAGLSMRSGEGAPDDSIGQDGEFYIDTIAHALYGPKENGEWPDDGFYFGGEDSQIADELVGGQTGQFLVKATNTNYDFDWLTIDGDYIINALGYTPSDLTQTTTDTLYAPIVHTHVLANITDAGTLAGLNSVSTANIGNSQVTYGKIQNVNISKLLGNPSGSTIAAPSEISLGTGLSFSGSNLNVSLSSFTTSNLAEGSNEYFTTAKARSSISATGSLSYNSGSGVISFTETYSSANSLLTAIKTVDGTGSGLDADLLDGLEATAFFRLSTNTSDDITQGTTKLLLTAAERTKLTNTSGTNSGDQNIFQTIVVSGQSNVVADSTTDSLTLAAGTGITITTNATTDTITFASSVTQYTDEMAQDTVAGMIQNGTGISWTYNDVSGTLTPAVSLSSFTSDNLAQGSTNLYLTSAERTKLTNLSGTNTGDQDIFKTIAVSGQSNVVADGVTDTLTLAAGTGITITTNASTDTITFASSVTQYTDEMVDDRVANLIQNGTGLTWSYVDGSNTLTGNVSLSSFSTTNLSEGSNLYYTDERVDDRVAALLQQGTGISLSYNDGAGTLTVASTITQYTDSLARTACVAQTITNGVTTSAPSQDAVYDALALKADTTSVPTDLSDLSGNSDDITEGSTNLFLTSSERTKLTNLSGTNTGDQDLSGYLTSAAAASTYQPLSSILTNTTASFTSSLESKLNGIASGAEVNVNADWNATSGDAEILNKPALGTMAAETASDYTPTSGLAAVALSNDYDDLNNKPSIPSAYTDEMAQDAIGAMIDSSLVYVDGTPLLTRAALSGDVTAPQGSNTLTLATVNSNTGSFGGAGKTLTATANAKGLITAIAETNIAITASQVSDFAEATDDRVATLLQQGTGITLSYNDGSNTLTIATTITQYTDSLAKSAAVSNSITNGVTDVAPSQDAVHDALATKINSDVTGVTGADSIINIIRLTQSEYDAIGTPNASTLYIIED